MTDLRAAQDVEYEASVYADIKKRSMRQFEMDRLHREEIARAEEEQNARKVAHTRHILQRIPSVQATPLDQRLREICTAFLETEGEPPIVLQEPEFTDISTYLNIHTLCPPNPRGIRLPPKTQTYFRGILVCAAVASTSHV